MDVLNAVIAMLINVWVSLHNGNTPDAVWEFNNIVGYVEQNAPGHPSLPYFYQAQSELNAGLIPTVVPALIFQAEAVPSAELSWVLRRIENIFIAMRPAPSPEALDDRLCLGTGTSQSILNAISSLTLADIEAQLKASGFFCGGPNRVGTNHSQAGIGNSIPTMLPAPLGLGGALTAPPADISLGVAINAYNNTVAFADQAFQSAVLNDHPDAARAAGVATEAQQTALNAVGQAQQAANQGQPYGAAVAAGVAVNAQGVAASAATTAATAGDGGASDGQASPGIPGDFGTGLGTVGADAW